MMKILFALALLIVVAAAADGTLCRPQGCVNKGAVCDYVIFPNVSLSTRERNCKGDEFCKVANTTTDITGICTELADVGAACTIGPDCEGFPVVNCVNKFCNRGYLPGAKCKIPNDCLYYAENGDLTVACNSGKCGGIALGAKCSVRNPAATCLPPNVCGLDGLCIAPLGQGAKCAGDEHCQINLFCNDTCLPRVATGQACDPNIDSGEQCVIRSHCIPNAQSGADAAKGTCKERYTGLAGSICRQGDLTACAKGLTCLSPASGSTNNFGSCGPTVASTRRACNASASAADNAVVCAANEACVCNSNTGTGSCYNNDNTVVSGSAKKNLDSAAKCVEKCARTDYNCAAKCESKICAARFRDTTSNDNTDANVLKCAESDEDIPVLRGYVACSTGSFVQFSLIGLVAIIAALLF